MRRARRAGARAALLVAALAAAVTSPGRAATAASPTDPSVSLSLVRQPAWVLLGGDVPLRLDVDGGGPGLDVRVEVHEQLLSRIRFERTVTGESLGSVIDSVELPLDGLPTQGGDVVATIGLAVDRGAGSDRLVVRRPGVYPMVVSIVDPGTGAELAGFTTWLVTTDLRPVDAPLAVAWIWSLVADPLMLPDGSDDPAVLAEYAPGGRLGRLAAVAADDPDVPLTLAVSPETLSSWSEAGADDPGLASGVRSLRRVAESGHEVLAMPWVPLDLPALAAAGMGGELGPRLADGVDTLQELLGIRLDPRTAFVDPVDPAALDLLRTEALIDRVVVREQSLVPQASDLTPARRFRLAVGTARPQAAATNPGMEALLEAGGSPALRAQRLLAGLALVAQEAPSQARGLVLAMPPDWDPDPATVRALLTGLRTSPYLDPVTLDGFFERVPLETSAGEPTTRELAPTEPGVVPVTAEELARAREELTSFRALVGADDPRIRRGEAAIRIAPSATFTTSEERARAREGLQRIDDDARQFLGAIRTTERSVTLTGRRARIPISFRNDTGQPVRVRVHLASSKLIFPEGADHLVELAEGNTTERFPVEARTSGTFTLTVSMTSEDGMLQVGSPTEVTVRTTIFSGMGAWLSVGALVFLALWWASHHLRARRGRRSDPQPA